MVNQEAVDSRKEPGCGRGIGVKAAAIKIGQIDLDHNHRFNFAGGNQPVHNIGKLVKPEIVVAAAGETAGHIRVNTKIVQKVKRGKGASLSAWLVSGRHIYSNPPEGSFRPEVVEN